MVGFVNGYADAPRREAGEAFGVLNGLLEVSAPVPRVLAQGGGYEISWSIRNEEGGPLAAACALALVGEL